jgi:lysozyme
MANALGCDVSFYQDDNTTVRKINFVQMKSAGASFVILRAGQNIWRDEDFADYWRDSKAAGLLRGSYFMYDPRVSPTSQAKKWLEIMNGDFGELPMFLDIELAHYSGDYWGAEHWKTALEYIKARTNHQLAIYTAPYVWKDNCPTSYYSYYHQYPLWIANYQVSSPSIPLPWTANEWVFWQFTSTGDGLKFGVESKGIDLNYHNGTVEQLYARYGGTTPPPVEPPAGNVDTPFVGVTRVRGDGVQVLTIEPGSIDKVEIV